MNFYKYKYADIIIRSTSYFGELSAGELASVDERVIDICLHKSPLNEPAESAWVHRWPPERGGMSLALSDEHGFLLRFPDLADFAISTDPRQIGAWPAATTAIATLRHLLLDQVLPRVLAHQGRLVLHAGAVRVGHQAVAFIGGSGSGKSTLSASFHAAGYPLLSDDGLVLSQTKGVTLALPTYQSLRLWPEAILGLYELAPAVSQMAHYSSKRRIIMTDLGAETNVWLPLTSIYVLGSEVPATDEISVIRLSPSAACMAIIGNSFQLDLTDTRRSAVVFETTSRVVDRLPTFSLTYPRDFACLPEIHDAIIETVVIGENKAGAYAITGKGALP
jgi:hypothetical protein